MTLYYRGIRAEDGIVQMHVRTADGIVHAFHRRQYGSIWITACGIIRWAPAVILRFDEEVDCMSCVVHEARR